MTSIVEEKIRRIVKIMEQSGQENISVIKSELQKTVWHFSGVFRKKSLLESGLNKLLELQKRFRNITIKNKNLLWNNELIEYSRIDYSKYGITQIFITMVEENAANKSVESNSINYLEREINLYHTLYFFVKIPIKYNIEEKEKIFIEIIKEIQNKEFYDIHTGFYLNFDIDYSEKYQSEILDNNETKIVRILTGFNSNNFWKGLFIDKNYKGEIIRKKLQ